MMAIIGFLAIICIGFMLVVTGIALTYGSMQFSDRTTLTPLLISAVGAVMIYMACHMGPLVLTVAP